MTETKLPFPLSDTIWTIEEARHFVASISETLTSIGTIPHIVGSVKANGFSSNDLDLSLKPIQEMSLDDIIGAIDTRIRPLISTDATVNPLPAWGMESTWFLNLQLTDGRIVEFYLAESDFPIEDE